MHEKIKEIVLSREAITAIAQEAADMVKRQLLLDDQIKIDPDQLNKLADKISTRLDAAVDYDRIKNAHLSEIRKVEDKFKNYELTDQDRIDIAEKALLELDLSDEIRDTLARSFVSKLFFNEQIGMLTQFVSENKGRAATAGISGKEMIEDINKVLGTDWQTGGEAEGDMLKSVYDGNDDGKVGAADAADSVPWDGVTDKPALGDVISPGSANVGEVAIADSTDGKQLAYADVVINAGKISNVSITEQTGNSYVKTDTDFVFTTTGASGGSDLGRFGVKSGSIFRLRMRTGGPPGGIIIIEARVDSVDIFKILRLSDDIKFKIYTNSVSDPPTDAELDAIFGTPATVGAVFTAYINNGGAGNNFYIVHSDGANWHTVAATKAV